MSDLKENMEEKEIPQESVNETISSLFEGRDRPTTEPVKEEKQDVLPPKPEQEDKKKPAEKEEDDDEPQEDSELVKLKDELEKTRKDLQTNRSFGRQNAQKVKTAIKTVQNMITEGVLNEDEGRSVLESLQIDQDEEDETPSVSPHPFAPIFKVVNGELEHLRKYSDDPQLEEKLNAFEYLLGTSSQEEVADLFDELKDLVEEPLKLTKKILSLGQESLDSSYRDIMKSGGIKNYISDIQKNNENLKKKVDKLLKKLAQYEDYDKPIYRLGEMGETENSPDADIVGSIFKERDRPRR